ncbi:MAG: single-stranded DNA-binding protein [Treponema sp.]|jgi:single-strand DNA-binding protein|nr:single-stranded DNA-binding protein [Treponema sp.]
MNNLNSVLLEGELIKNPDYQTGGKNSPVCRFTLASNRFFKSDTGIEKETCCLDIEARGKLAAQCYQYGRQGRGARVVGRLKQEHSRTAEGNPLARIVLVAEHIEFRPLMTPEQKQLFRDREDHDMGR